MSDYNEAIKIVDKIYNKTNFTKEELQPLIDYLDKSETTEKEHEALKRDVAICKETLNSIKTICNEPSPSMILSLAEISKRYIEIDNLVNTYDEKLSKVGKEE